MNTHSPQARVAAPCPLCGQSAPFRITMPIDSMTFRKVDLGSIFNCQHCNFGFIWPRPSPQQLSTFYELDEYYTHGASGSTAPNPGFLSKGRIHLAWRADKGQSLLDTVSTHLPVGGTIVDIGCGDGSLIRELAIRGFRPIGVERDLWSAALRSSSVPVLEGSAENLPNALERSAYDAVVFSHVLEHLADPVTAVRNAMALLKPGGRLICEVPNNESAIALQSGISWHHLDVPRHINFFTRKSLQLLLEQAGLQFRQTTFSGYCRYFSDAYIATEQHIFDHLPHKEGAARNSTMRSWLLLARTAFAPSERKYDAVGAIAVNG